MKGSRLVITLTTAKAFTLKSFLWKLVFYLRACGAHKLGFELALEEVHYKGVISHLVSLPCLLCYHLHQQTKHIIRPILDETKKNVISEKNPRNKFLLLPS